MYSCIAIRAGTDGTLRMELFAKIPNSLSHWLFSLRARLGRWISSSSTTPSKMEHFAKVI